MSKLFLAVIGFFFFVQIAVAGDKLPWQMTRSEWHQAGSPDFNLTSCWQRPPNSGRISNPPWKVSQRDEMEAINDYLSIFESPIESAKQGKTAPAYLEDRDGEFASTDWEMCTTSSLGTNLSTEDAREAIILGRKLGYPEESILFYILRNYVFLEIRSLKISPKNGAEYFKGFTIPKSTYDLYPALR